MYEARFEYQFLIRFRTHTPLCATRQTKRKCQPVYNKSLFITLTFNFSPVLPHTKHVLKSEINVREEKGRNRITMRF